MSNVIWKYPLWPARDVAADEVTLEMPRGARILHVADQDGRPAQVQIGMGNERRTFRIFGTGRSIESPSRLTYRGSSIARADGWPEFVWHVYELDAPEKEGK